MTLAEMLEANSIPEPNSGCSIWLRGCVGGQEPGGAYPVWRRRRVSHLALSIKGVAVPEGFHACHRCDNTFCINPDHLFVGTAADNRRDAQAKGRLKQNRVMCKYGHSLSGDNLYVAPKSGNRQCRICIRRRKQMFDAKQKASRRG
jgi:hypothetical protein